MRAYIKKLQRKEEYIRKQILAGLMIVCMAFVGLVWYSTLTGRFNRVTNDQVAEGVKPFKLFTNSIGDAYENITASVGKVSDLTKSTEGVKQNADVNNEKMIDLTPVIRTNN